QPIRTTLRWRSECSVALCPAVCGVGSPVVFLRSLRGGSSPQKIQPHSEKEHATMEDAKLTATDLPKWSALLIEAVTNPGLIMKAYSAFHTFSVGNQILALVQCQMRGLQPARLTLFRS